MRTRARLGDEILRDEAVAASAELSPLTYTQAEDDIRGATTGKHGLLTRGVELDADALMVRATVLTYRWIDELAGRRLPDPGLHREPRHRLPRAGDRARRRDRLRRPDRDRRARPRRRRGYLNELAENNPELMDHVTSGGGGLLDGLQMRSLLTAACWPASPAGWRARGGLRAVGSAADGTDFGSALRDVAGGFVAADAGARRRRGGRVQRARATSRS